MHSALADGAHRAKSPTLHDVRGLRQSLIG